MTASKSPPDWSELLHTVSGRFAHLPQSVLEILRDLMVSGRDAVGCAEAALMVPAGDGDQLRFLVSVNSKPGIEEIVTQLTVPCDRSIAGCVFNTGQLIAIANPEDFYQKVDQKTGLTTSIYMAVPVIDEGEVLGVATFVNRPEGEPQEPFDESEIEAGMQITHVAVAGLRYYQRIRMQQRLLEAELGRCGDRLGVAGFGPDAAFSQDALMTEENSPLARAITQMEKMNRREQDLAAELIGVLTSYSES